MTCYRVVRRKYANLSGEGASLYGGRFNPPGISAVYTSQSIALALLEVLVHIDKAEVPIDYVVMAIRFAGQSASRLRGARLAGAGQLTPTDFKAAFHGRPILRVPSVIVPREFNYILLPEAVGFRASLDWVEPLDFDRRLVASVGR
jgi:RES domain-containing protein